MKDVIKLVDALGSRFLIFITRMIQEESLILLLITTWENSGKILASALKKSGNLIRVKSPQ